MYVNKLKKVKIIIDKKCCLQSAMLHLFCEDIVVIVVVVVVVTGHSCSNWN